LRSWTEGLDLANDDSAAGTSGRTSRFLPGIHVLRHYRRAWLRGDVVADCTDAVVGEITAGLPRPSLPDFGAIDLGALVGAALGITVVGYTDNVLTARAFAVRAEDRVDPQQEFLALSASNLSAGVFQGFPVSSSGSRTAVGDAAGSRTQLHSLVALAVVLLTLLALRPVLSSFPLAALAAIVVFAALRLIDIAELRRIGRFRRSEIVLAVATTAGVLVVGVLYGIAVAIALSVLALLRRIARPHDAVLGYVPGLAGMHDIDDYRNGRQLPGLLIYRYDSPLFFANADDFERGPLPPWTTRTTTQSCGLCSTPRPSARSTSPARTPWRICGGNWPAEISSLA
jgi:sulfate permease, SulP family